MNKGFIFFLLSIFILFATVKGGLALNVTAFYTFETGSGTTFYDQAGGYANNGTFSSSSAWYNPGIAGTYSADFRTGTGYDANVSDHADLDFTADVWAIEFCANITSNANRGMIEKYDANGWQIYQPGGTDDLRVYFKDTGGDVDKATTNGGVLAPYYNRIVPYVILKNGSGAANIHFYINKTLVAKTEDLNQGANDLSNGAVLSIGDGGGGQADAIMDEIRLIKGHINISSMTDCSGEAPPGVSDLINITSTVPEEGTIYNTISLELNATIEHTYNYNATLHINGVVNQTITNIANDTINFIVPFKSDQQANFTYELRVYQFDDSTQNESSANTTFFVDNVAPYIYWNVPDDSNNSLIFNDLNTFISLSDNNLYSFNLNITDSDDTYIANFSNNSLSGFQNFDVNKSLNLSGQGGVLHAVMQVWDGHTKNKIKDFNPRKYDKELYFDEDYENVRIIPKNKGKFNGVGWTKKLDRYTFDYETVLTNQLEFWVESDYPIIIMTDSEYDGHLITGNKWIDFEHYGITDAFVERINDYKVKVTFTSAIASTNWQFNSVGELNSNTKNVRFFNVNTTKTQLTPYLEGQTNLFSFNISYNSSFISSISNVKLTWNGTVYTPTSTAYSDHYEFQASFLPPDFDSNQNVSYYWNYTIQNITGSSTAFKTQTNTQELFFINLDDCSVYSNPVINFTLNDELTLTNITGNAIVNINFTTGALNRVMNKSFTGISNFEVCITPNIGNVTADYIVKASAFGYEDRDLIQENVILDTGVTYKNIYLLSTGNSSEVTLHVTDDGDIDLQGILIEAYKFDAATNTDILVETERTTANGNAVFNLQVGTEEYSFKFYQNEKLVISTAKFKVESTTYEYVISDALDGILPKYLSVLRDVNTNLDYNNATDMVTLTWTSTSTVFDQMCLRINKWNGTVNVECSSETSGSLNYTIVDVNETHIAKAEITTTNPSTFTLDTLIVPAKTWQNFGTNGLVFSLIIFLTISLLAIVNKNLMIITEIFAVIMLAWVGMIPLAMPTAIALAFLGGVVLFILNRRRGS